MGFTLQIAPGLKALSLAPAIGETTGELSWVKLLAVDAVDASDFMSWVCLFMDSSCSDLSIISADGEP